MRIVGVDVGGTFTDFHIFDQVDGTSSVFKLPSTPENPADAIIEGLRALVGEGIISAADLRRICHGTTVATNALIQRKGGAVALITTHGFRDLLEIGRQTRPHMYDPQLDNPPPLVPREMRHSALERLAASGEVVEPLTADEVDRIVSQLLADEVRSCAVCLLFSFLNSDHERMLGEAIQNAGIDVSLSSEVQPEFREYERMSTTVLNAYLVPVMNRYLERLENTLAEDMPGVSVGINQSSGGLMSVRQARRFPVRTALSGPAGGVIGAGHIGRLAGAPDLITLDMGGTSADVCLVTDGKAGVAFDRSIGGFPVRLPMVDVNAVGAGGGSIAAFDAGGMLKVGPLSAGARPGPACYGLGGDSPTVTDANLLLGRLSPRGLLGGRLPLDAGLAAAAYEPIAKRLGMSVQAAAHGCIEIVVANMVRAIRTVSVERGLDPRNYALMPFGGGGPLHAEGVARALGMRKIVVPPNPGILCAQGIVLSDLKENLVRTMKMRLSEDMMAQLLAAIDELAAEAEAWFALEEVDEPDREVEFSVDLRYAGQNYELPVPVSAAALRNSCPAEAREWLAAAFNHLHELNYGHSDDKAQIELINLRAVALGRLHKTTPPEPHQKRKSRPEPFETRPVWFEATGPCDSPVYDRTDLDPGHHVTGPAVVEQLDTTTLVCPDTRMVVDDYMNLILELD